MSIFTAGVHIVNTIVIDDVYHIYNAVCDLKSVLDIMRIHFLCIIIMVLRLFYYTLPICKHRNSSMAIIMYGTAILIVLLEDGFLF